MLHLEFLLETRKHIPRPRALGLGIDMGPFVAPPMK